MKIRFINATASCLILLMISGCAAMGLQEPKRLLVPEVIVMSLEGDSDTAIIDRLTASGTVYWLEAGELSRLREEGVSNVVINHMQNTYLESVRNDQALEDLGQWTDGDGWFYGGIASGE